MSDWIKLSSSTARRSARSTPKIKFDTTSDNEENDDVKRINIPGDFNNYTTRFINSVIHEQKPKTKQPKNEIHHRPVYPEITISSTPGAWWEEASSSPEEEEAAREAVKEEEEKEEEEVAVKEEEEEEEEEAVKEEEEEEEEEAVKEEEEEEEEEAVKEEEEEEEEEAVKEEEEEEEEEAVKEEEEEEDEEEEEEAVKEEEEEEDEEEVEDTVEVSGALARRPSLESVQYPRLELGTSRKPSTTPKFDTHPWRSMAAYAFNKPTKAHPTPPTVKVEYGCQSVEIEDITMEEAPPIAPREFLQPNYNCSNSSSGYGSDSDSDSGQASVFSGDTSYDTPDESDSDMSPSKELAARPPQSHVQDESNQASANGEKPVGKVVAAASWGGGMRVIVSIGPEKARKYIILSHTEGKREYKYDLSTLPKVNSRRYSRSEKEKVTRVCGVALSGAGPEVLNVGKGERNPYIYVRFQWGDGTETWENGAPARELIANMKKRKPIMTDLTPQEYLYFEAKEAWRLADELSKRDQPTASDDE